MAGLILYPLTTMAQDVSFVRPSDQEAVYSLVAEYADSLFDLVFSRSPQSVAPAEIRMLSTSAVDEPLIERMALRSGSRIGDPADLIECEEPDGLDCVTKDGSRAGFVIGKISFGRSTATVTVELWMVSYSPRLRTTMLTNLVDRLYFARASSGWRLDRVQRVSEG
ncbi:MAG: hypothetical protein GEU90_08135 [Gemmatimonas sp.]|nr:hypothetical protein [Gemmatimonas sp.]